MTLAPLDGYAVGITAHRRWEEQAELLRRKGARIVHGPVIRTAPLADTDALLARTEEIITSPPDVVVLMTGIGVRSWIAATDAAGCTEALLGALRSATVMARGPKALGAANTAGLTVTWTASSETSDEIVEHLASTGVRGRRVAVQRDGGRPEVAAALEDVGADVVDVPVYEWTLPDEGGAADRLIDALLAGRLDALTFTTPPAVENLMTLAGRRHDPVRAALADGVTVAAVGPLTAAAARAAGAGVVVEPARARLGAMVQCLARHLAERRREWRADGHLLVHQGMTVAVDGHRVELTGAERRALDELTDRPGTVVAKGRLAPDDHAAEVLVGRLRRRLGTMGTAVEAVPRRGYRWRGTC